MTTKAGIVSCAIAVCFLLGGCTTSGPTSSPVSTPSALQRLQTLLNGSPPCQGPLPACFTGFETGFSRISWPASASQQAQAVITATNKILGDCQAVVPRSPCDLSVPGLKSDLNSYDNALKTLESALAADH